MQLRRIFTVFFVALGFLLSVALPANLIPAGGSFPAWWHWGTAARAADPAGAPGGRTGHYVPAAQTKAAGGTGRKPVRVAKGLPAYQPFEPKLLHYRGAKAKAKAKTSSLSSSSTTTTTTGQPQIDVRFPPNNWDATTLTPQLMARGHDPDNSPNTGLKYRFSVFRAESGVLLSESDWLDRTMWTVPSGSLEWGKSYLYTVESTDNQNVSPEYPAFLFSTPVPQPALAAQLADDARQGFHPGIGNYTTEATDLEVATIGPDLELARSYNSLDTRTQQALGRGWTSILDARAVDYGQTVTVSYPDGQEAAFGRQANGKYQPPAGRFATLTPTVSGSTTTAYTLIDKNATSFRFAQGAGSGVFKISSVTDANGRSLTFAYNGDGTVSTMTSASGRAISLVWATPANGNYAHIVEASADPAAVWKYTYDNDRLVKVCDPASPTACTQYEYQWMSQYANAVHNQAPTSFWRLGEPAGATMAASSVDANAGVDNGTYANVALGQAAALDGTTATSAGFNGTSSYVQLPGKLVLEGSYQAVSMWFKTTAVNGVLFSFSQDALSSGTTPTNYTPALYVGSDGKLRGQFWQGDAHHPITSGAAVNDGNWHHVTLSANGSTQTLYVDGYAQGSLAGAVFLNPDNATNVYLGGGFLGGDWPGQPWTGTLPAHAAYFNGAIAEVAYFGRALPEPAAYDLFNIGKWPRAALTKVTGPSGAVTAQISYDGTTGKVAAVIDNNGGSWTIGTPSLGGNSNVYAGSVLGGKPADYWRLGDAVGTTDASNEVRGGTAVYRGNSTLQSTGPFPDAKAVKFDGSTSYVELSSRNVPTTGPAAISLWFTLPQGSTAGGVLYSYQEAPMTDLSAGTSWTPALYVGTDGKLRGGLWAGAVSNVMTGPVVNDGKWHQVVLTAESNSQVLYLDGVQVCSSEAAVQTTTGRYAYIGAGKWAGDWPNHSGDAGYFGGSIAEFAYHQAKLTADQVSAQYRAATQSAPMEITRVATGVTTIPMPVSTVRVTDPGGRTISYSYDALKDRRVIKEEDSLGKSTRFGYDTGGYANVVYDANGVLAEQIHDVRGNVIQATTCQDQAANRCSSEYFSYFPDATTTLLDPDPRNDVPLSSRDGRSASATDGTYLTSYTYDAKGNRTEEAKPLGLKTVIAYTDGTTVAAADGGFAPAGLPYRVVSPSGGTQTTTYFKNGDVAKEVGAGGASTAFTYDVLGRKLTETDYSTTFPGGLVTTFTYDAVGRVLTETEPATVNRLTTAKHTSVTLRTYNADGQVTQEEVRDTTGGDPARIDKTSYDAKGRVESTTDATGAITRFAYDDYGHVIRQTAPDGAVTLNVYDGEGQLLEVKAAGFTGDPNNPAAPVDLVLEYNAYDPTGRLASKTDSTGSVTRYTYTDNGLTATVRQSDGTNTFVVQDNGYDGVGNLIKQVTNNGVTVVGSAYDAVGRKTSQTVDPAGLKRTTAYQHSRNDDVVAETETDAAGAVVGSRHFMYDAEHHQIAQTQYRSTGIVPVGRWKLQGDLADKSGNSPLAWQSGTSFDGNGYLRSAGPALDTQNSFTATAWVYLTESAYYHRIVAATGTKQSAFDLRFQPGKWVLNMHTADANNAGATQVASTSVPPLNTWVHLAATYDAAGGGVTLFVNGVQEGTGTIAAPIQAVGPMMIGAGRWNGGAVDKWQGDIKDVQFYQRALTASEIGQVKSGSAPPADAGVTRSSANLDNAGLVKSSIDALGNRTDNTYDEAGRLTQTVLPAVQAETGGNAPALATPTTTIGYDTFGAVTHRQDPTGDTTVTAYDAEGRVVSTTLPGYTPPAPSTAITASTVTTYDPAGRIKTIKDPLGNTTTHSYDQLGRLSRVLAPDGGVTTHVHDGEGRLLATVDPVGARTTASYDYLDRPVTRSEIERSPAATLTTSYTYGYGGWLAQERSPAEVVTSTSYNTVGERLTTTDGSGNVTAYAYDGGGRLTKVTNPDGTYVGYTHDLADRELKRQSYSATATLLTTESKAYNARDQLITATDARGTTTTLGYNEVGWPISLTEPISPTDSIATSFGYDVEGKRTRYSDGRGNKFVTTYNTWGLPESLIEPSTAAHPNAADRTFTVSYDANGRSVQQTQPGGVTTTTSYDVMGRVVKQTGAGAEVATADRTFGYDQAGRMTSASGNTFSYSDRDLLLSVAGPSGNSSYTYTADGNMASRIDAAGTTGYTYDGADRLATVDNAGTGAKEKLVYNSMSQVSQITYGSGGSSRTFSYDGLHRLTQDELKSATDTTIGKITYGWDANGNLTSKSGNTYSYDLADRLTSWNTTAYGYDKAGNRTQNGAKTFTYDERNRLLAGNGMSYDYSPRGSLRSTVSGGVSMATETDSFGQVMRQFGTATGSSSYTYDGLGRVLRPGFAYTGLGNDLATDGTTRYTREPDGDLLGEANGSDQRLAWTDLHTDVVGQFTASGTALAGSAAYDPMGKVTGGTGMIGSLGFQSEWTDGLTGRVNMLSRWYNPETGQFDSRDTADNDAVPNSINANRYQYGDGTPLTTTDPTGHAARIVKYAAPAPAKAKAKAIARPVYTPPRRPVYTPPRYQPPRPAPRNPSAIVASQKIAAATQAKKPKKATSGTPQGLGYDRKAKQTVQSWYQGSAGDETGVKIVVYSGKKKTKVIDLKDGKKNLSKVHAGGIAIIGDKLYVANSDSKGKNNQILVFKVRRNRNDKIIGFTLQKSKTIHMQDFRVSALGVSKDGKELVAAEYQPTAPRVRVVSLTVGKNGVDDKSKRFFDDVRGNERGIQGITKDDGGYLVTESNTKDKAGGLYRLHPIAGGLKAEKVANLKNSPEGLTWGAGNRLYYTSEHEDYPGRIYRINKF